MIILLRTTRSKNCSKRAKIGGYVFYGPGRAGPPAATLATLSCEGVRMALIVDRADSDLTQRRRSKQASAKTKTDFHAWRDRSRPLRCIAWLVRVRA